MKPVTKRFLNGEPISGVAASPGIASGRAAIVPPLESTFSSGKIDAGNQNELLAEIEHFKKAVRDSKAQIRELSAGLSDELKEIFTAQELILEDPELSQLVQKKIRSGLNSEGALAEAYLTVKQQLEKLPEGLFREKLADLEDVVLRLRSNLIEEVRLTDERVEFLKNLSRNDILIAEDLSPSHFLNAATPAAIVVEKAGPTGHLSVLATSRGIPLIVRARGALQIPSGTVIEVDGTAGQVKVRSASGMKVDSANREGRARSSEAGRISGVQHVIGEFRLSVNLETTDGLESVAKTDLPVGLFRSEFIYLKDPGLLRRGRARETYRELIDKLPGRKIRIRLLDPDEDKYSRLFYSRATSSYKRGPDYYKAEPAIFEDQIKCILDAAIRAERLQDIQILVPQVASLRSFESFYEDMLLPAFKRSGVDSVPVGVMIETPGALYEATLLSDLVDFFSLGTNDLVRHLFGVSRADTKDYNDEPLLYYLLETLIDSTSIPVSVCGSLAGQEESLNKLISIGFRSFSVAQSQLPAVAGLLRARSEGKGVA